MELLSLLVLVAGLNLAALRWGRDSRRTPRGYFGAGELLPPGAQETPSRPAVR